MFEYINIGNTFILFFTVVFYDSSLQVNPHKKQSIFEKMKFQEKLNASMGGTIKWPLLDDDFQGNSKRNIFLLGWSMFQYRFRKSMSLHKKIFKYFWLQIIFKEIFNKKELSDRL